MTQPVELRLRAVGECALLVEVNDGKAAQATYRLIRHLIDDRVVALKPPRDVVPAARTVLLDQVDDVPGWRSALMDHATTIATQSAADIRHRPAVVVPVRYNGVDLGVVAATWRCSVSQVISRHAGAVFQVAFCGFAPGFAYCTSDLDVPPMPRHAVPRTMVPAGSVALAGPYCGIYPRDMPGGWQIIATTQVRLFDPERPAPALLSPGDRLRFVDEL